MKIKLARSYAGTLISAAFVLMLTACGGRSGMPASSPRSVDLPHAALSTANITEYALPSNHSFPIGITAGPDGAVWFTEHRLGQIGRITTSGSITEYSLTGPAHFPFFITTGPDGRLWFTENSTAAETGIENQTHGTLSPVGAVGRMTTAGVVQQFVLPAFSDPRGITTGSDGNIWFANRAPYIGKLTTTGALTQFATSHGFVGGPAVGPDNALWFTETFAGHIGRISTSGAITDFDLSATIQGPVGIVTGVDGNLWFTEFFGDKVSKITTGGALTEYPVSSGSAPRIIVSGPDGALYFTEYGAGKIGRITTSGVLTDIATPTPNSAPWGIAVGPDGNIWFAESNVNKIGKLNINS